MSTLPMLKYISKNLVLIFLVNGKMCVCVDTDRQTGEDRLMVRVGRAACDALLERPDCLEMDFADKPMKGFLFVYPEGFDSDGELDFWEALVYSGRWQLL